MNTIIEEVQQFVEENDVKFIRLAFCDIFGIQRNISIFASELPRAFKEGISFDASAIRGFFKVNTTNLFLFPDASTIAILPWRPSLGRVVRMFCNVCYGDGSPFEGDFRQMLKKTCQEAFDMGYQVKAGVESEFYLFKQDEEGNATKVPFDNAGYMDIAPMDKGENVRREICLSLEEMGIEPVSSHHERGPGQNEVEFRYSDASNTADNFITFKSVVRTIAEKNGLSASFLPKPLRNHEGNGLHINLSLYKDGENMFESFKEENSEARSFVAGVMRRIREITLFLNPMENSYERFGRCEAPKYITWSEQNHSQLICIPNERGSYSRMELRSPDCMCNPYIAFHLLIQAGLEGIRDKLTLPVAVNADLNEQEIIKEEIVCLPESFKEAKKYALESEFLKQSLSEVVRNKLLDVINTVDEKER